MNETSKFFELTGAALSEASSQKRKFEKAGDANGAEMWAQFHRLLTEAHAGMHVPQYNRLKK